MPKLGPFLDELLNRGGTALHLAAGAPPLGRVRGELVAIREGALEAQALEEMLVELLTPAQRSQLEQARQIELAYAHQDGARFRAACFHCAGGLGAVFLAIPSRATSLVELGCPEVLWRIADRGAGLVLVAGPARSGKSTTIAALLDHINKTRACHVLTVEDPIEHVLDPMRAQITQREVGAHAPTAEAALRNAEREDADVVYAGELRTAEAVRIAARLASSGVLVYATVRAHGVAAAVQRLVSEFSTLEQPSARGQLAEALCAAVGQVMVRGKSPIVVHEVLLASPAASAAIREGKTSRLVEIMRAGDAQGMLPLDLALDRLVSAGRITAEMALEHACDKEAFARVLPA